MNLPQENLQINYYYIQHQPTRGFQSSVDLRPHIGLPTTNNVDIEVTWTNGLKSNLDDVEINQIISISQSDVDYSESNNKTKISSKALFERLNSDINFSVLTSTPLKGSSKSKTLGLLIKALAKLTLFFCPEESSPVILLINSLSLNFSQR